ncbi:MAG: hypothetical protein Q9162_004444 [Coniocarpon cinnabarinum]
MLGKRKRGEKHPYLSGNFAPQQKTLPLTPCSYVGTIPSELLGGQYVRNGSNPVKNEDLGRDAHWFDGDGMLSGVYFTKDVTAKDGVRPEFVNQYILTDIFLSSITTPTLKRPALPSITTLSNPFSSLLRLCWVILRAVFLTLLSRLPGSAQSIEKISVANTSVLYHDGRALATCESGPPLRVQLPALETVGWYNGQRAEGEPKSETQHQDGQVLGGEGVLSFMREWTTAHPKVDPTTGEMFMFHCTPLPPYVHYTTIPSQNSQASPARMNVPLPGVSSAKMMHDFGVSREHTVIMDLPLSLDPLQLLKNNPVISYDSTKPSRFGVFPRSQPDEVRWFETIACCIFHTANTWETYDTAGTLRNVNLLACRLTSAAVVFTAGNIKGPRPTQNTVRNVKRAHRKSSYDKVSQLESTEEKERLIAHESGEEYGTFNLADEEDDQCRLYYYSFDMVSQENRVAHQFALSPIPFEFPSTHPACAMEAATFVYGCSSTINSFNPSLGRASLIDCLVKFNVPSLIARGKSERTGITDCVDWRNVTDVLKEQHAPDGQCQGDVQIFKCPDNIFTQEPRFVPRENAKTEDDGYLVFYTFDETQLDQEGAVKPGAVSELWVIDALDMKTVIAKIRLPQRVPYGLHGSWFPEGQLNAQRPVQNTRQMPQPRRLTVSERLGRKFIDSAVSALGG